MSNNPGQDQPSHLQGSALTPAGIGSVDETTMPNQETTSQSISSLETVAYSIHDVLIGNATATAPAQMNPELKEWIACVVAALRSLIRSTKTHSPLLEEFFRGGIEILQRIGNYFKTRIDILRESCTQLRDECDAARERWDATRKQCQRTRENCKQTCEENERFRRLCKRLLLQGKMSQAEDEMTQEVIFQRKQRMEGAFRDLLQQERTIEAAFCELNQIEQVVEDTFRELHRQEKIVESKLLEVQQLADSIPARRG